MTLHLNSELFDTVVVETSETFGVDIQTVIKDYYVTLLLKHIVEINKEVVFKGGTSLSKCYGVIKRFSEDIDLTIRADKDMKFTQSIIKRSNKLMKQAIDNAGMEILNLDNIRSGRKFNRYEVSYMKNEDASILSEHILLENTLLSKAYPTRKMNVESLIRDYLVDNNLYEIIEENEMFVFEILVQDIKRTFVDKVFAISDYYLHNDLHKHSRHIYDIYKIMPVIDLNNLKELILEVREERKSSPVALSADERYDISELLNMIAEEKTFKDDYNNVTSHLLYEEVAYETAITGIERLVKLQLF